MSLFEKFNPFKKNKPKSKEIKEDNNTLDHADIAGIKKEYGHDNVVDELNESIRIKSIVTGKDPMESSPEDQEAVENLLVNSKEDREIIQDNISLLKNEITHTEEKIKQYNASIIKTEEALINDPSLQKTLESLLRMKSSYEEKVKEIESQIKQEEQKLREFYNLN